MESYWNEVFIYISRITFFSGIFILLLIVLRFRMNWNKPLKVFFYYYILTLVLNSLVQGIIWLTGIYVDFFSPILEYWEITNTFFFQILFQLKNFILLSIFYHLIFPIKHYKKYILRIGQILSIIALVNYFFIVGYKKLGVFNPSANVIYSLLLPLIYLWYSQEYSLRIPLSKNPYFWFSIGLIIPNLIGAFIFFAGDYIHTDNFILYCQMYSLKNLFEILGQILIAIGFSRSYYTRFIKIA